MVTHKLPIYFLLALFSGLITPVTFAEKEVAAPKKIFYDGRALVYNPAWKSQEIWLKENIDDDPEKEIIISFVATYKPQKETSEEETPAPYTQTKQKEPPPSQNYVFYQIYDKKTSGYYELAKTISGMDQLGSIELAKLNEPDPPAIFIVNPGGERYRDLSVYQWKDGGFRLIFNKGTSAGLELDIHKNPPALRFQKAPETEIWDVFVWDLTKKTFRKENDLATPSS